MMLVRTTAALMTWNALRATPEDKKDIKKPPSFGSWLPREMSQRPFSFASQVFTWFAFIG
jgi:hypothetical protein